MKKQMYCEKCDKMIEKEIKTKEDIKNIKCQICGNKDLKNKKILPPTKLEKTVENITYTILNIYYYFYFVTSLLGLIFYITKYTKAFEITSIIIIVGIIIDYIMGYTRNIFGTLGLLISIGIGIYILNDTKTGLYLGIVICTLISSTIKLIINKIINKLFRKYG